MFFNVFHVQLLLYVLICPPCTEMVSDKGGLSRLSLIRLIRPVAGPWRRCFRPRRLAQWDMQRTMRGSSTPRMKHIIPLPDAGLQLDKRSDYDFAPISQFYNRSSHASLITPIPSATD